MIIILNNHDCFLQFNINDFSTCHQVPELKKALKDRGISVAASAKKTDLVAKLKEVLTTSTSDSPTAEDDFEKQLAEITAGKTGVSLQVPSTQNVANVTPTGSSNLINKQTSNIPIYTGSSLPRTSTTNTSTTSTANGAGSSSGKLSSSTPSATSSLSTPKSSGDATVKSIKKVTTASSSVHPLDKLAARAARFGSVEETTPGSAAATTSTSLTSDGTSAQLDALKKRSEKFGVSVSPSLKTLEEKEKLALRASRFNLPSTSSTSASKVTIGGGTKRLNIEEDEKLKKRRERFGLN